MAVAEIERAAIEGAEFRAQLLRHAAGARPGRRDRCPGPIACGLAGTDFKIAAHAGGEVDDDVLVLGADAFHHSRDRDWTPRAPLPVLGSRTWQWTTVAPADAASSAELAICSGRHRNGRMLADRVAGAGYGAGDDDVGVQASPLPDWTILRHGASRARSGGARASRSIAFRRSRKVLGDGVTPPAEA